MLPKSSAFQLLCSVWGLFLHVCALVFKNDAALDYVMSRGTLLLLYWMLQRLGLQYASDVLSWQHLPTVGWDSSSRWWPRQHEPVWSSGITEPKVSHSPSQTPFYAAAQTHEVSRFIYNHVYSWNWAVVISCIFSTFSILFF